ncbi:MAG: ATP-binding cassette domain-containing protein [Gammaproteobacteria bacterium]|nr:MAG: ATP-binding cassette domain-containing protein [Gammaproteobacteria bacterium]UCH41002.1 MAG: ATP-binding cassette domain-containing protein [Gammaproteobacteria bacterium]
MAEDNLCIALNQVGKSVDTPDGKLDILKNISLDVKYQEAVVIKGASGSGKTTLLGLMAGLDQASSGDVFLFGENLTGKSEEQRSSIRAGRVGFVFQSFHLVQGANALQNVMLPLELAGIADAQQLAVTSLNQVGLENKTSTLVEHLSGGEQQRVAIARAFAVKPTVLFADEPTGNLDAATGRQIADLMFHLRDQSGTTLVLVTHEGELLERGDRQILIESGRLLSG